MVSNIGFSMNTHFCGGEAVKTSFSLGIQNPDCGMENRDEGCESNSHAEKQNKPSPCCENQHQMLQLDENIDLKSSSIVINPVFFIALIHAFVQPLIFTEQDFNQSSLYSPTIPDKNIQVLYQTFLI